MKRLIIPFLLLWGACVLAGDNPGTVTETREANYRPAKYTWAWSSSTNNHATDISEKYVRGSILRVVFVPGSGTNTTPENAYDVTLLDSASVDVLGGLGANLSSNATACFCPGLSMYGGMITSTVPYAVNDYLTVTVTNTGSGKTGQIILYVGE